MAQRGGKREGAGRPSGSKNKRPRLADFLTPADVEDFNEHILTKYKESDRLAIWMGEQIYGKALQALEIEGGLDLSVTASDKVKKLADKLNEIHRRRTGGGNGAVSRSVGAAE